MESFRKAYGALKDSTKVGLAKVNSDFKVCVQIWNLSYIEKEMFVHWYTFL